MSTPRSALSETETRAGMYLSFANKRVSNVPELMYTLERHPWTQVLGGQPGLTSLLRPSNVESFQEGSLRSSRIPIHAVIIGINSYASYPLSGAIPDAQDMIKYLKSIGVPGHQITPLLDQDAKREDIIRELKNLKKKPAIIKGDLIIIFYAGHGTELEPQEDWETGGPKGKIQAIVPQDHCDIEGKKPVHVIPSRTLGVLISGIAKAKGDNIVVIFDSCYSGSATRTGPTSACRFIRVKDPFPASLDSDVLAGTEEASSEGLGRTGLVAKGHELTGFASHVLISACNSIEEARESSRLSAEGVTEWRGNFTVAFLDLLRGDAGVSTLTYADIPKCLELERQSPQVEGINRNRLIFRSEERPPQDGIYEVQLETNGRYRINAGAVLSISTGAHFTVYGTRDDASRARYSHGSPLKASPNPIGTLQVKADEDVKALSTILSLIDNSRTIHLDAPGFAVQTKLGVRVDLRVFVELTLDHLPIFYAILEEGNQPASNRYHIVTVDDRREAHLEFKLIGNAVTIDILDDRATRYKLYQIPSVVEPKVNKIHSALRAAAHFYRYLDNDKSTVAGKVTVEVYELEPLGSDELDGDWDTSDEDEDDTKKIYPVKAIQENLVKDGVVDLIVGDKPGLLGVKITNNSRWGLYPYAFLFENSDLSIAEFFSPQYETAKETSTNIPLAERGGTLAIGYGAGGGRPYQFTIGKEQDIDITFLKVFLTTKPTALSSICRRSVFNRIGEPVASPPAPDAFGTITIPIVQRRHLKKRIN